MLNSSPRLTPFSLCFFNQSRVVNLKNEPEEYNQCTPDPWTEQTYEQLAPFVQQRLGDRHFMDSLHNANSILTDTWILYKHTQRYRRHLHDYASSDLSVSPRDVSPRDISTSVSGEESITLALASLDYLSSRDISTSVSGEEPITLALASLDYPPQEISLHQSHELNPSYWHRPVGITHQVKQSQLVQLWTQIQQMKLCILQLVLWYRLLEI